MNLRKRATNILQKEGPVAFVGRSLQFAGSYLLEQSENKQKKDIIRSYSDDNRYLNVGGGDFLKENWRVLDYYSQWYDYDEIFVDFNIDLEDEKRWPIDSDSYELIYSSHTLEHLSDETVGRTLEESLRILKSGGKIRINVPDIDIPLYHYEEGNKEWFEDVWLENYVDDIYFARDKCEGYDLEFYLLSFFATYLARIRYEETDFGEVRQDYEEMEKNEFLNKYSSRIRDEWQREYPGWHRNWFTTDRLRRLIRSMGFKEIRVTNCRRSRIPEMCTTEFDKRPHMSLFIEATKP